MKQVKKIIFLYLVMFVFVITIIGTFCIEKNNNKITRCELSKEYLKWEQLSEEEKTNAVMPNMCKLESNENVPSMVLFGNNVSQLPDIYDGRIQTFTPIVKNQTPTNGCWAFSSTSALEFYTNKYFNLNYEFSTRHMVYSTTRNFLSNQINDFGFNKVPKTGGNFFMSSNYFINSLGSILESEMPFEPNEDILDISSIQNKTTKVDINNIILNAKNEFGNVCTSNEIENIKKYVYNYGSVAISTYMTTDQNYYNSITSSFYYNGTEDSNHAVLIVGWDDNYSKDNFASANKPSANGAWIVQNSYGTKFGNNGYYYISYEDIHICDVYMAIQEADLDIEDNSYIYDKLGFNLFYGYNKTDGYAMNVFTKEKEKKEEISEITLGSSGIGYYEIYYTEGNGKNKSVTDMKLIGSGDLEGMGYFTHKLEQPLLLDNNITDFSIVVYYEMLDINYPIPVSAPVGTFYQYVNTNSDKSFISSNGRNWEDLKNVDGGIIASIKVFTNNVEDVNNNEEIEQPQEPESQKIITSNKYKIDQDKLLIYLQPNTNTDTFKSNVEGINSFEHTGLMYTGLKVDNYTVIVLGDVNGDGYSKMNDVMMISNYIVNGKGLNDIYKIAADANLDLSIRMNDVMKISNYIVEGGSI